MKSWCFVCLFVCFFFQTGIYNWQAVTVLIGWKVFIIGIQTGNYTNSPSREQDSSVMRYKGYFGLTGLESWMQSGNLGLLMDNENEGLFVDVNFLTSGES